MVCRDTGDPNSPPAPGAGWVRVLKNYSTQEDCEKECDSAAGACTSLNGVCRVVKACLCGQNEIFAGVGTTCNPLP